MNVLDAAKALAGREPLTAYGEVESCIHCRAVRVSPYDFQPITEHLDDCPWLMLGALVAALEAAYGLTEPMLSDEVLPAR